MMFKVLGFLMVVWERKTQTVPKAIQATEGI